MSTEHTFHNSHRAKMSRPSTAAARNQLETRREKTNPKAALQELAGALDTAVLAVPWLPSQELLDAWRGSGYSLVAAMGVLQRRVHGELAAALAAVAAHQPARLPALLQPLAALLLSLSLQQPQLQPDGGVGAALGDAGGGGAGAGGGGTALLPDSDPEQQVRPWEVYIELWRALLLLPAELCRTYSAATQRRLRAAVYDALISAVLDAARHLDLSYSLPPPGGTGGTAGAGYGDDGDDDAAVGGGGGGLTVVTDLYGGLVANDLYDMMAFFHMRDFLGELLPAAGPGLFARWALPAAEALCGLAAERPLVSATYRPSGRATS
eukprot:XP_001694799.1 predicted protein [Chlamydomonas reinhardtii]